jgi:hypothetical protein
MKFTIYEINYSVSPRGQDTWAISSDEGQWYEEGFTSAGQALECVLRTYPKQVLEVEVKSLAWYFEQDDVETVAWSSSNPTGERLSNV